MICEYCNRENDGSYGSGRFCNQKCARGFATKDKRKEINERVSKKLQGKKHSKKKREPRSLESRNKQRVSILNFYQNKWKETPFEKLSKDKRREILLEECNHQCIRCGQGEIWQGEKLSLHLHHIDGNKKNISKNNNKILCPNCHAITENYGFKNPTKEQREKLSLSIKRISR
jgi:5-methylcytosine-specific restriction endonuclease McrA